MEQKRQTPVPGDFYRHFKNRIYQIMAVAVHSETGEPMVVYQAMYGDFRVWVRPLAMFLEPVDREKYPEACQRFRFEKVYPVKEGEKTCWKDAAGNGGPAGPETESGEISGMPKEEAEPAMNPYLMEFLDALDSGNYDRKLACLARLRDHVTQKELDDIYMVMDMQPAAGDTAEQLAVIRRQLLLLQKFDGERLR